MPGAAYNRGNSKQDYATPWEFIRAVEARFGMITLDLAADKHNAKSTRYISKRQDSLKQQWRQRSGLLWLNPPYADIAPWAKKCAVEHAAGARIALLVPASVGANWFAEYVHGHALWLGLHPRIVFQGEKQGYPKDLILAIYSDATGFEPWRWK